MDENTFETLERLYRRAFAQYGTAALWNMRQLPKPTVDDALAITHALRTEGNLAARELAFQIEKMCHAIK